MLPRPWRALSEHRSLCCLSLSQGCGGPATDFDAYEAAPTWLPNPQQRLHCHLLQLLGQLQLSSRDHEIPAPSGDFCTRFWGGVKIRKQNRSVTSLNVCMPASPRASPVPAVGPAPIINHHPWRGNVRLIPGTYCGGRACLIQCNR